MENQNQVKTPFKRLLAGIIIGELGLLIALLTPVMLLLTFKVMEVDPEHVTASFALVSGTGAIFAMFSNPVGGAISDRTRTKFGRRRTWILLGALLGGVALLGIALSTNIIMIVIFWCLAQTAFNFALSSFTALVPDQIDESRRGLTSGIIGLLTPFGPILGMVIATVMGETSLTVKFITIAGIGVISAIVSCILIKEGKFEHRINPTEKSKKTFLEIISKVYPSPRKYPVFTWAWLTRFFVSLAYCSSSYNALMLMQRYNYTEQQTTGMATVLSLVSMTLLAVASIIGGSLSDKLRKQKPFVACSAIVVGLALVINALAPSYLYILIGNALAGFGYGIYTAVDMALIARILPRKEDAAKDFGIMNIANTSTQSIVPFIGPALLGIGGWPFFFGSLAVSGLLSAAAVIPIPEVSSTRKLD